MADRLPTERSLPRREDVRWTVVRCASGRVGTSLGHDPVHICECRGDAFGAFLLTQLVRVRDETTEPARGVLRPIAILVGVSALALMTALALVWGVLSVPELPEFRFGLAAVAVGLVALLAAPAWHVQRQALNAQVTARFVQAAVHATLMLTFASMAPRSVAASPVYAAIGDVSGVAMLALVGMCVLFGAVRDEVRSLWRSRHPLLLVRYAGGRAALVAFAVLWFCLYLPGPVCGSGGCASSVDGTVLLAVATVAAALAASNAVMSWRRWLDRLEAAVDVRRARVTAT